jgi:hypothetical protein
MSALTFAKATAAKQRLLAVAKKLFVAFAEMDRVVQTLGNVVGLPFRICALAELGTALVESVRGCARQLR